MEFSGTYKGGKENLRMVLVLLFGPNWTTFYFLVGLVLSVRSTPVTSTRLGSVDRSTGVYVLDPSSTTGSVEEQRTL